MPALENLGVGTPETPLWSADEVTVVFVLGGPGAGKGTQCAKLVSDYGFKHLSAGDLLREEQDRPGSEFGEMIKTYIKEGTIVPMEVTVKLLENAMKDAKEKDGKKLFLIDGTSKSLESSKRFCRLHILLVSELDGIYAKSQITGFPRKLDQAHAFESSVVPSKFTLFFDCPEDVMQERLLNRGLTSGRADDNLESIKKRFKTFVETSMPVVDEFETKGKVVKVMATRGPDEVYEDVKKGFAARGIEPITLKFVQN
jgi:UMP-CMP kinase